MRTVAEASGHLLRKSNHKLRTSGRALRDRVDISLEDYLGRDRAHCRGRVGLLRRLSLGEQLRCFRRRYGSRCRSAAHILRALGVADRIH